jgi:hypothetical protein
VLLPKPFWLKRVCCIHFRLGARAALRVLGSVFGLAPREALELGFADALAAANLPAVFAAAEWRNVELTGVIQTPRCFVSPIFCGGGGWGDRECFWTG